MLGRCPFQSKCARTDELKVPLPSSAEEQASVPLHTHVLRSHNRSRTRPRPLNGYSHQPRSERPTAPRYKSLPRALLSPRRVRRPFPSPLTLTENTSFVIGGRKYKNLGSCFGPWTTSCCDVLERNSQSDDDRFLVVCLRLSAIKYEASNVMGTGRSEHSDLLLYALGQQALQIQQSTPPEIAGKSKTIINVYCQS